MSLFKIEVKNAKGELIEVDDAFGGGYDGLLRRRLRKSFAKMVKKHNGEYVLGKLTATNDRGDIISTIKIQ